MRANKTSSTAMKPTISTGMTDCRDITKKIQKKITTKTIKSGNDSPIFLRKTYHMIGSCAPEIATWSVDGGTFVVKQPEVFEKTIIPQFFKHSKFSSFVRQLNFYGFRKIKYSDTIIIDTKLEAETADFWRFKHDKFIRGKPELLTEIRRHNSQSSTEKDKMDEKKQPEKEITSLKSEVDILKDQIADMTKNIDNLTVLVQNITVNEPESQAIKSPTDVAADNFFGVGNKRKKLVQPESVLSSNMIIDDVKSSSSPGTGNPSEISFTPGTIFPSLSLGDRQESSCTNISDDTFMEQMLGTLEDDLNILPDTILSDGIADTILEPDRIEGLSPIPETQSPSNVPDPELMKKLFDALSVLPHKVQEMLVNRLIATITSSDVLKSHIDAVSSLSTTEVIPKVVKPPLTAAENNPELALPLAAAALSAILTQFSSVNMKKEKIVHRSLPVISMHA